MVGGLTILILEKLNKIKLHLGSMKIHLILFFFILQSYKVQINTLMIIKILIILLIVLRNA